MRPPAPGRESRAPAARLPSSEAGTPGPFLVALDGSPFGESALLHGRVLARALGRRLHLVTVLDPARSGGVSETSAECRLQLLETAEYLASLARSLQREGVHVDFETREGDPAHEVLATARERKADLVLVAARPRRREECLLSRGVAQGIIAGGTFSILISRGRPVSGGGRTGRSLYGRIAVGLDGSAEGRSALRVAEALARAEGADLLLVRVVPPSDGDVSAGTKRPSARAGGSGPASVVGGPRGIGEAATCLDRLRRRLSTGGCRVETELVLSNRVAAAVEGAAREAEADLLVVGARGSGRTACCYGGCARWLLLRGALPLLVVREPLQERIVSSTGRRGVGASTGGA